MTKKMQSRSRKREESMASDEMQRLGEMFVAATKFIQQRGYSDWDGSANGQTITLTGCANLLREYQESLEAKLTSKIVDEICHEIAVYKNKWPLDKRIVVALDKLLADARREEAELWNTEREDWHGWAAKRLAALRAAPRDSGKAASQRCSENCLLQKGHLGKHWGGE
jgi:hypothetical protein